MLRVIRRLKQSLGGPGKLGFSGPAFFFFAVVLLAGTHTSEEGWERLGPPGGMVTSMAATADGTVYLGTPDGHIFVSVDRGEEWELRGRAGERPDGVVQAIVPDARNPKRLLAAVWFRDGEGGGVFASGDAGKHWSAAGLEEEAVRALMQAHSDPEVWIAGTRRGVFRSDDGAKNWRRITAADDPELQNVDSLEIDPNDPRTIYVGTYHLPWKTTDGGRTWSAISTGMIDDSDVMSLRIDAHNAKRIFSSACSGIYRSDDSGASWTKLQGIPYSSRRTQQIVQDPTDAGTWYAATTEGLWKTPDNGETWKRVTGRDTDVNAVVALPAGKGRRIVAGMGAQGVVRSDDGGESFIASNSGFSHRVIAAMAADRRDARRLLVRAEGYATLLESDDGGSAWRALAATGPGKSVDKIFPSSDGWWVTYSEGGLARIDAESGVWRSMAFRETTSRKAARGRRRAATGHLINPHVFYVTETVDETFAATNSGLWSRKEGAREFGRVPGTSALPSAVTAVAATSAGSLVAIAGGELWSGGRKEAWNRMPAPSDVGGLLWVSANPFVEKELLVGTHDGVFASSGEGRWCLLARGLPAIGSGEPGFSGRRCLIAMANGSFYESWDGLQTWQRVEAGGVSGKSSAVLVGAKGGFLVASQQEGVLLETGRTETQ